MKDPVFARGKPFLLCQKQGAFLLALKDPLDDALAPSVGENGGKAVMGSLLNRYQFGFHPAGRDAVPGLLILSMLKVVFGDSLNHGHRLFVLFNQRTTAST